MKVLLCSAWFDALPITITWKLRCSQIPYRSAYISGYCFVYKDAGHYNCSTVKETASGLYAPKLVSLSSVEERIVSHLKKINIFSSVNEQDLCVLNMGFRCPSGYDLFEDFCYKAFKDKKTFAEARSVCQSDGGDLPEVHSDTVNARLAEYVYYNTKSPIWLGIHIIGSYWNYDRKRVNNNHNHEQPYYFRWMFQDYGNTHAVLDYGIYAGYWRSLKPTESHSFVCQIRAY
ncbi:unnamed protein product [Bursaphelenchus xylophilus]|uniref:(pine wood nematode) hypothetical protein n=1 Tax=Bursaphelenchus xylophilus TaxID=6326 RepID=A0A1I7SAE5_BURXY|nr:unnamed protein product [Bursaphelenchus xylophilus]CAG9083992.1 unnamed protein product [Bursaphelenchus xylophilus]